MKDQSIVFIRTISMLFIIICHVGQYYGSAAIGQLFNVGVPIFLFLSGFLYGKKDISRWSEWSIKRWCTLTIPIIIWLTILQLAGTVLYEEQPSTLSWLLVVLNLEGLSFIVDAGRWAQMTGGLGHLWFLTAIMLCYACIPVLQKARPWICSLDIAKTGLLIVGAIIVKCSCDYWLGVHLGYLLTFSIGYFWSRSFQSPNTWGVLLWCAIAVVCCALRMGGKILWDDSFLYSYVIVGISQPLLAIAIFNILYGTFASIKQKNYHILYQLGGVTQYIDKLTYYIYITHYIFLTGAYNVNQFAGGNVGMQLGLFFLLTTASAVLLERLSIYPIKLCLSKNS